MNTTSKYNVNKRSAAAPPDVMLHIIAFHEKYKIGYDGPPRKLDPELQCFRTARLLAEMQEYRQALLTGDEESKFDALLDLIYIAVGEIYLNGYDFNEGWRRVQKANMAKELASAKNPGQFGSKYDIVKPPGWMPPCHADLVTP